MFGRVAYRRRFYAFAILIAVALVAMAPAPGNAQGKLDQSREKKGPVKKPEQKPKTPREPEWLPARDLLADSLVLEFATTEQPAGGRPATKIRRQHAICLRAVFPRQEQAEKIAAALPELAEAAKQPLTEPEPNVEGLLQILKFRVERQEAAGKPGSWDKLAWQEVSFERSVAVLSTAQDFDDELVQPPEYSPELTSPLPKLDKGKWDARVLHPRLKENKLPARKPAAGETKSLQDSSAEWETARYLLFRFFDFEAKYGRSYRYRVKILFNNPAFEEEGVPPEVAEGKTRESSWSEPSPAVTVGNSSK